MKKFFLSLICLATAGIVLAQTGHEGHDHAQHASQTQGPELLNFKETEFDFGKIPQNKPVYHYFEVVNTGTAPISISNITASCGCTTPEWSKDPIPPGGSQKIKVGYNAAAEGYFEKFISVQYNGNQTKQVKIKGTVWKAPAGSAPTNESLKFLKQQIQER